ncbi:protein S100-A9-like [Syngnathoides biaculeatus]|uniref:protein S100-A9-like n=1 Tax=Syngnathoides biaculeatus TaxID=300417 RepID=UPI002ADD3F65|nr:protein S100-A9-like [Syngnathoides biaculeatus]
MPYMQDCIDKFVDLFEEYSSEDSDCLNRDQFKALVSDEINSPDYKGKLELCDVDEVFDELDKNNDGELTFQEYISCMAKMIRCHRKKAGRKGRKGGGGGRWGGRKGGKGRGSESDDEDHGGGPGGKGGRGRHSDDDAEESSTGRGNKGGGGRGSRGGGKAGRGGFDE